MLQSEEPDIEEPPSETNQTQEAEEGPTVPSKSGTVLPDPQPDSDTAGALPSQLASTSLSSSSEARPPPSHSVPSSHSSSQSLSFASRRGPSPAKIPLLYPSLQLRVLVVEDNKINVKIMLKLLQRLGWPIEHNAAGAAGKAANGQMTGPPPACSVVYNGVQCLELLHSLLSLPDAAARLPCVILMDIAMGDMDGLECTRRIHAQLDARYQALGLPPPYIIACTATTSEENRRQCAEVRMHAFLSKPISIEAMVHTLKQAAASLQAQKRNQSGAVEVQAPS